MMALYMHSTPIRNFVMIAIHCGRLLTMNILGRKRQIARPERQTR